MKIPSKFRTIALASAVLMFFSIASCSRSTPPKKEAGPEQASQQSDDQVKHKVLAFNLEGLNEKGGKKWDVRGESAEAVSETEVMLDNIVAKAYGEEAEATITADHGVYNKTQNNVRLEKNVKATIDNTNGSSGGILDFTGVASDKSAKKQAADKAAKRTTITCDGDVLFNYEQNLAYFTTNVKVRSDDGNIDADKITVTLDPATKKVKEIIAEGNVKIEQNGNVTYSSKATYVEAEKKVVLTGQPKIVVAQDGGMAANFFSVGNTGDSKKK